MKNGFIFIIITLLVINLNLFAQVNNNYTLTFPDKDYQIKLFYPVSDSLNFEYCFSKNGWFHGYAVYSVELDKTLSPKYYSLEMIQLFDKTTKDNVYFQIMDSIIRNEVFPGNLFFSKLKNNIKQISFKLISNQDEFESEKLTFSIKFEVSCDRE